MDGTTHTTGRLFEALVLVAVSAALLVSAQTGVAAQTSTDLSGIPDGAPLSLSEDEEARVRRALDEAKDASGREVLVCHLMYTGGGECSDYLLRIRTFTRDDAVIYVNTPDRTMVLVQAPGLSAGEISHVSDSMTAEFRQRGYAAGIVRGAEELEDRLARRGEPSTGALEEDRDLDELIEDRLREMRGIGAEKFDAEPGSSWTASALIFAGTAAMLVFLVFFLRSERYREPAKPRRNASFYRTRRAAEESVATLAPKVLLLSEKEKAVAALLESEVVADEDHRRAELLIGEAAATGFWERFAAASDLIEYDPGKALEELRGLSPLVEAALTKLEEAVETLNGKDGRDVRA